MGLYKSQWILVQGKTHPEEKVEKPKEGQIYNDYWVFRDGAWSWRGPVR